MPSHQNPAQKETVERVMHEFKHGELKTARGKKTVKNPKQAIAIALHEAGASKYESPKENARNLRRTKEKERKGETGRDEAEGKKGRTAAKSAKSGSAAKAAKSSSSTKAAKSGSASKAAKSRSTKTTKSAGAEKKKTSSRSQAAKSDNGKTRAELYAEARRRDIPGRSKMSKEQLERALHA